MINRSPLDVARTVATEKVGGIAQMATVAQAQSGTRRDRAVTPYALANAVLPSVNAQELNLQEGSNARMGVATMVAGTVTVSNTAVTANSRIFLSVQSLGTVTAPQAVGVTAKTAGTSFVITSADNTDTSVVAWMIVEPTA